MAGWLPWATSIVREAAFCSYWNRHLLWIQICLPCYLCTHRTGAPSVLFASGPRAVLGVGGHNYLSECSPHTQNCSQHFTDINLFDFPSIPEVATVKTSMCRWGNWGEASQKRSDSPVITGFRFLCLKVEICLCLQPCFDNSMRYNYTWKDFACYHVSESLSYYFSG